MKRLLAGGAAALCLVVFAVGMRHFARDNLPGQPTPTAAGQAAATTFQGDGAQNTPPLTLQGGTYRVGWEATARPNSPTCAHTVVLHAADDREFMSLLLSTHVPTGAPRRGDVHTHDVPPGRYYLNVTSTCTWSLTIAPQ